MCVRLYPNKQLVVPNNRAASAVPRSANVGQELEPYRGRLYPSRGVDEPPGCPGSRPTSPIPPFHPICVCSCVTYPTVHAGTDFAGGGFAVGNAAGLFSRSLALSHGCAPLGSAVPCLDAALRARARVCV